MNIIKCGVRIKGIRISEGLLYCKEHFYTTNRAHSCCIFTYLVCIGILVDRSPHATSAAFINITIFTTLYLTLKHIYKALACIKLVHYEHELEGSTELDWLEPLQVKRIPFICLTYEPFFLTFLIGFAAVGVVIFVIMAFWCLPLYTYSISTYLMSVLQVVFFLWFLFYSQAD